MSPFLGENSLGNIDACVMDIEITPDTLCVGCDDCCAKCGGCGCGCCGCSGTEVENWSNDENEADTLQCVDLAAALAKRAIQAGLSHEAAEARLDYSEGGPERDTEEVAMVARGGRSEPFAGQKDTFAKLSKQQDPILALRLRLAAALNVAVQNGKLEDTLKALNKNPTVATPMCLATPTVEEVRAKAEKTLMAAADDGRLEEALRAVKGMPAQHSNQRWATSTVEEVRAMTEKALMAAADDGRLEEALRAVKGMPAQHSDQRWATSTVEELRARAEKTFMAAADDGRLEEALRAVQGKPAEKTVHMQATAIAKHTGSLQALKNAAISKLFEAAKTGALEDALASLGPKESQASSTDLVDRARRTLFKGVKNGQLKEVAQSMMATRRKTADVHPSPEEDMQCQAWTLRSKTATALIDATKSGQLEDAIKALKQQKEQQQSINVEVLRAQVQRTLAAAVDNGQLKAVKMAMKSATENVISDKKAALTSHIKELKCAVKNATAQKEAKLAQQDIFALRAKTGIVLAQAARSGSLEAVLAKVVAKKQRQLNDIRSKVAKRLSTAVADGSLEACVESLTRNTQVNATKDEMAQDGPLDTATRAVKKDKAKRTKLELTRSKTAEVLINAATSGALETAVKAVKRNKANSTEVESIRSKAAEVLMNAATSGALETAMKAVNKNKANSIEVELSRSKAAEVLISAANSGALDTAIRTVKKDQAVKAKVAAQLADAVRSGRLEATIMAVKKRRQLKDAKDQVSDALKERDFAANCELAAAKAKAAHMLACAVRTGSLEGAVENIKSKREVETARQNVASALGEAIASGRLVDVIEEVRAKRETEAAKMQVKSKVANILFDSVCSGALVGALSTLKRERQPEATAEAPSNSTESSQNCSAEALQIQLPRTPVPPKVPAPPQHPSARTSGAFCTKRRIIGAVSRISMEAPSHDVPATPRPVALQIVAPTNPLTPGSDRKSKPRRSRSAKKREVFRLDLDDEELVPSQNTTARGSHRRKCKAADREASLESKYRALGATAFHRIDSSEEPQMHKLDSLQGSPEPSKVGSAMALDLGEGASSTWGPTAPQGAKSPRRWQPQRLTPSHALSEVADVLVVTHRRPASMRAPKKHYGLLPTLDAPPFGASVASARAWSLNSSRASMRWQDPTPVDIF